jgi:hypothetical protein
MNSLDNSSSNSWFGSLKKKMSSLYNTAKGTPVETTSLIRGGSKKKRSRKHKKSKKTKKVRFSKKNRIYTVRRYKK